jgi:hypothetical protein
VLLGVPYLGMSGTALAQITELAELGVCMSAWRGEAPARDRGFEIIERQERINE